MPASAAAVTATASMPALVFKTGCGLLRGYWSRPMMIVLHTPRYGVWVLCGLCVVFWPLCGFLFLVWWRIFRLGSCRVGRLRGCFYVAFEYPVWGVVEGVTEPINADWRRRG